MGELVAAIAHEVNQPLAAIVTNANFCLRQLANATPYSSFKEGLKKKETESVAVCCEIAIGLRPGRLGRLKKLAFLQEHDVGFPQRMQNE